MVGRGSVVDAFDHLFTGLEVGAWQVSLRAALTKKKEDGKKENMMDGWTHACMSIMMIPMILRNGTKQNGLFFLSLALLLAWLRFVLHGWFLRLGWDLDHMGYGFGLLGLGEHCDKRKGKRKGKGLFLP